MIARQGTPTGEPTMVAINYLELLKQGRLNPRIGIGGLEMLRSLCIREDLECFWWEEVVMPVLVGEQAVVTLNILW